MPDPSAAQATELLQRACAGDGGARERLLELLYAELHALAEREMRGERVEHTLQPTALAHEAWLRLVEPAVEGTARADGDGRWRSRAHFLAVAAKAMRNVLVDHARGRQSRRRGAPPRVELEEALAFHEGGEIDVLALDDLLERLARRDGELARVVELRFFGGLTTAEVGAALGLSVRQVEGAWVTARGWLRRELEAGGAP